MVTRCSNNFGPYQFPEKVIPLFTTNLLDGQKVPLYGDGGNIRDWIHVHDHNTAADLVLRQGTVGEIYNIGAGNEITNKELTLPIARADRARRELHHAGRRSSRSRSSLLDHPRQGAARSAGRPSTTSSTGWRQRSTGTATTGRGGSR